MSLVSCPRCNAPNDAPPDAQGRMRCVICNHVWTPRAAVAAAPAARARPAASVSQEYFPDDPASEAPKALTTRQAADTPAARADPPPPPATSPAREGAGELRPHSDRSHGGVIPPLKVLPKDEPPPARQPYVGGTPKSGEPASTTPTVEVDMDLFDRLEKEAQSNRAKQATVAELTFGGPESQGSANGHQLTCPVCGHSFVATTAARAQTCPQCHTTFDHASGRFATLAPGEGGDLLLGRNLRGCVIDRKLGEGGMGSVYHARQLSLDRSVAIKVLPPDLARNRNFIQRFEREAKSLAKINHPNILHIYDFGEEASLKLYFMIIEFVDGTDLGEILNRRNTLPQLEVLDLLRQASQGLEMAAAKGVIHRDIKPDNLMLASDGVCKVSDFGLAKGYGEENEVTSIGVRVGTPAFMSPEQCDGIEVDWRSDVYNLGCTAFLCLTGRLPFDGETPFSIMLKHKNDPIPSVREISPSVDPGIDRLIRHMLAKKPADRCDSWRALVDEIESVEVQLSGDPNIMRKSRSNLVALAKPIAIGASSSEQPRLPTPPVFRQPSSSAARAPAPAPVAAPAAAPSPPPQAGQPAQLPDWLKPVEVPSARAMPSPLPAGSTPLPAQPSPIPMGATPIAARAPSRELAMQPSALARQGNGSASDLRTVERGASKRLNAELASAKDRGQRSQVEALIASADRLIGQGRYDRAAQELRQAAALMPDPEEAKQLRARAAEARARGRWRRLFMRTLTLLVVLALAAVAAWQGTPEVHNLLATRRYKEIRSVADPIERLRQLREFSDSARPFPWYRWAFQKSYELGAAADAARDVEVESASIKPHDIQAPQPNEAEAVEALEQAAQDTSVPWPEVADRATALLRSTAGKEKARVQAVLDRASPEVAAITRDLKRIQDTIAAGDAHGALAMSQEFRTSHQRAGRYFAELPLPGRVAAQSVDGQPIVAALHVDGRAQQAGSQQFVRWSDRDVVLDITARGYAPIHQVVGADSGIEEKLVAVTLQAAPVWTRAIGHVQLGHLRLRPASEGLYIQRPERVDILRVADGEVAGTLEPIPGAQGASYTAMWAEDQIGGRILVGGMDGEVRALEPRSLHVQEIVHKGPAPVLAWLDIPLSYQMGVRARYIIEEARGRSRLVALKGDQEWWPYQALRGDLAPQLLHVNDQVVAIDDASAHFLEEDGSNVAIKDLPAPRTGPLLVLPGDEGCLEPTAGGVQWLKFGKREQPLVLGDDKTLLGVGAGIAVLDGKLLVVAHPDAVEALTLDDDHFTARWKVPLEGSPAQAAAGEGVVAICDAKGRILLLGADAGEKLGAISCVSLVAPPLIHEGLLVVPDENGQVTAYALPHATR